ncbi:hypothetical protein GINT2_001084 [Glugoides intestinalis]
MIEIEQKSKRGFAYGELAFNTLNSLPINYIIEKCEIVRDCKIWSFSVQNYEKDSKQVDLHNISNVKCTHGNNIVFKTVHRLPQDSWQELIDCWSCHNNEFKEMLNLKISPRPGGILLSNFYLLANQDTLPECCKGESKFFYNEIKCVFSDSLFIYKFFEEHFEAKSTLVLRIEDKNYEIKLFYSCVLCKADSCDIVDAFKVGFKITDKNNDNDSSVGEYFKNQIFTSLKNNSLKIAILDYEVSFITL